MSADTQKGAGAPPPRLADVASLRARLFDAGFRPVPIYNADSTRTQSPGKAPMGDDWGNQARLNPPACVTQPPHPDALNTGILCDGLRAIDVDIDNPTIAASIRSKVLARFGETPMRYRSDSPRCLLVYRAAEGQPAKRVLKGTFGKVEILGRGQQFVAFGQHPNGGKLQWMPEAPGDVALASLAAITEADIDALLAECAPSIGGTVEPRATDRTHASSARGLRADSLQVLSALHAIPNEGAADWEGWNRIGMAIWAATGGAEAGRAAFHAWSEQHPDYDATETDRRWDHYRVSPPTSIGAGSLFHMAKHNPSPEPAADTAPAKKASKDQTTSLPVVYFRDIVPRLNVADFVEGLLIDATMAVVYGQSNSGKTFWMLDVALHVASGKAWCGREIEQRGVLWLAMEGSMGAMNRVVAWCIEHKVSVDDLPFAIIPVSLDLLSPDRDTAPLISTIKTISGRFTIPVGLTVVDTLSRAMAGGNENAPDDMGALVTNGTRIQQETKSTLVWIHHAGKDDAKGARGHSLLRAATDTEIEITADGPQRTARVTKQREMDCAGDFSFTLKVVEIGVNKRRKPVTSCVVVGLGEGDTADAVLSPRLKGHPRRALEMLHDLLVESGRTGYPGVPDSLPSVPEEWWRQRFYDRTISDGTEIKQDSRRAAFNRASSDLQEKRLVGVFKGRVWAIRGVRKGQTSPQTDSQT